MAAASLLLAMNMNGEGQWVSESLALSGSFCSIWSPSHASALAGI